MYFNLFNSYIDVIVSTFDPSNPSLALWLILFIGILLVILRMPGVKCPRCAEKGIEQWVLPGKHCPRCNQPC